MKKTLLLIIGILAFMCSIAFAGKNIGFCGSKQARECMNLLQC